MTPAMSEYHETAWSVWGKKKKRRLELPDREVGNIKNKSRENRKQKNENPTRHRGGRGRMKDRSMYNRLMK